MQTGIVFPQTEIGDDPALILEHARTTEESGFTFLLAYDHVLGADWAARDDHDPHPYDASSPFHEPFVLFAFLAGRVSIDFATGVIVLPQRQTALVAKQAAAVDVLSGGRLRLGVGIGWNEAEYEALGERFTNRGRRIDEQVVVLRRLWTEPTLTFEGRYHRLHHVGILPRPVQQPIPVWFGSSRVPAALERVGRIGDGWMSTVQEDEKFDWAVGVIRGAAEASGRDPSAVGLQRFVLVGPGNDFDGVRRRVEDFRDSGIDYTALVTMNVGRSPTAHVDVVGELGAALARG